MPLPNANDPNDSAFSTLSGSSTQFNVDLQVNQNAVAEGPNIPPPQSGEFRVPRPSGFGVQSITNARPMGSLIVFTWNDIDSFNSEVGEYRVFVNFAYDTNPEPTAVGSSSQSPCYIQVVAPQATDAVFYLRPYLANGLTLPLSECPTCTVSIPGPVFQFASGNDIVYIDDNRPTGGGAGSTTTVTFNTSDTWTVPVNVTTVTVECWGAGGQGADASPAVGPGAVGGGGGGGGGYSTGSISVIPGSVYPISVASGSSGLNTTALGIAASSGNPGSVNVGGSPGGGDIAGSAGSNAVGFNGGAGGAGANNGGDVTLGVGGLGGTFVLPSSYGAGGIGGDGRVKITYTTSAGTGSAPGIGVVNSNGRLSSLTDLTLLFINTAGKVTASIGTSGTGADPGFVGVYDGTAGNDVVLSPGHTATATGGAATLPANPLGFLKLNVGGTAVRVPYYNA